MGTNYYTLKKEPCPTCGHGGEDYHIGKSSSGWKFLFASYPDEGLTSKQAWFEFLKDRQIRDEYDDEVDQDEFWRMVDIKQNNPKNVDLFTYEGTHRNHNTFTGPSRYEYLDPEGYRISRNHQFS